MGSKFGFTTCQLLVDKEATDYATINGNSGICKIDQEKRLAISNQDVCVCVCAFPSATRKSDSMGIQTFIYDYSDH